MDVNPCHSYFFRGSQIKLAGPPLVPDKTPQHMPPNWISEPDWVVESKTRASPFGIFKEPGIQVSPFASRLWGKLDTSKPLGGDLEAAEPRSAGDTQRLERRESAPKEAASGGAMSSPGEIGAGRRAHPWLCCCVWGGGASSVSVCFCCVCTCFSFRGGGHFSALEVLAPESGQEPLGALGSTRSTP